MKKRPIVEVTDHDIINAMPGAGACPIACALKRIAGHNMVCVGHTRISVGMCHYDTPKKAQDFILQFDGGMPVEPFEFELPEARK